MGDVCAVSGPARALREAERRGVGQIIARLAPDTIVRSGGAIGVDSECVVAAIETGLAWELVLPAAPFNEALLELAVAYHAPVYRVRGQFKTDNEAYMARNEVLVAGDDEIPPATYLYAFPPTLDEGRSGTWATVRRARAAGVPVIMFPLGRWRDGRA